MIFKIRTSKRTMEIFRSVGASEQLQPFVLAKISIALSLRMKKPFQVTDFKTDSFGLELNRQTITGEFDVIFKCLTELKEGRHLDDDDYFKNYLKAHLDRGAIILESEHKYGENFLTHLLELDLSI